MRVILTTVGQDTKLGIICCWDGCWGHPAGCLIDRTRRVNTVGVCCCYPPQELLYDACKAHDAYPPADTDPSAPQIIWSAIWPPIWPPLWRCRTCGQRLGPRFGRQPPRALLGAPGDGGVLNCMHELLRNNQADASDTQRLFAAAPAAAASGSSLPGAVPEEDVGLHLGLQSRRSSCRDLQHGTDQAHMSTRCTGQKHPWCTI
jgi:hypothetical protein